MRSVLRQQCSPAARMRASAATPARLRRRHGGAAQHDRRGAVAEQGRGDEHGEALIVGARAQRAQLDAQEQDIGAGAALGQLGRTGEPADAAAAPEAEDRQPLDGGAEVHAVHEQGIEARDCEPGDGVDDDEVDIGGHQAGFGDRLGGNLLEEDHRLALVDVGALLPAARGLAPIDRHTGVAPVDRRVKVKGLHAGELREDHLRPLEGLPLTEFCLRIGGGYRQHLYVQAGTDFAPRLQVRQSSLHQPTHLVSDRAA